MSKKKQPVGVAIDDVTIKGVDGLQLSINDEVIGTIMPLETALSKLKSAQIDRLKLRRKMKPLNT